MGGINFKSLSLSTSPVRKSVSICFLLGTHYIESWVEHPESSSGCGQKGGEAGGSCQAQLFFRETQGRLSPSSASLVTAPKPYPRFLRLFLSLRARQHPLQNTGGAPWLLGTPSSRPAQLAAGGDRGCFPLSPGSRRRPRGGIAQHLARTRTEHAAGGPGALGPPAGCANVQGLRGEVSGRRWRWRCRAGQSGTELQRDGLLLREHFSSSSSSSSSFRRKGSPHAHL